jgi:hypothetical protein
LEDIFVTGAVELSTTFLGAELSTFFGVELSATFLVAELTVLCAWLLEVAATLSLVDECGTLLDVVVVVGFVVALAFVGVDDDGFVLEDGVGLDP